MSFVCKCGKKYRFYGHAANHVSKVHKDVVKGYEATNWTPQGSVKRAFRDLMEEIEEGGDASAEQGRSDQGISTAEDQGVTSGVASGEAAPDMPSHFKLCDERGGDASGRGRDTLSETSLDNDVTSGAGDSEAEKPTGTAVGDALSPSPAPDSSVPVVDLDTTEVSNPNQFILAIPDRLIEKSSIPEEDFKEDLKKIQKTLEAHSQALKDQKVSLQRIASDNKDDVVPPGCVLVCRDSDRERWLQARTNYIGSSDAAAIVGASHWRSAWDVWAEKSGLEEPKNLDSERLRWGRYLEPAILEGYAKEHGVSDVQMGGELLTSSELGAAPYASATIDAWEWVEPKEYQVGERVILEIKTSAMKEHWREGPPSWVAIQVLHQLMVTGLRKAKILTLFFGNKLQIYEINLGDPENGQEWREVMSWLREKEEQFWRLVQQKVPPDVDHSDGCRRVLGKIYKAAMPGKGVKQIKKLPYEASEWIKKRSDYAKTSSGAEKIKAIMENNLRKALGDFWEGETDTHWVSWKPDKNGKRTLRIKEKG